MMPLLHMMKEEEMVELGEIMEDVNRFFLYYLIVVWGIGLKIKGVRCDPCFVFLFFLVTIFPNS